MKKIGVQIGGVMLYRFGCGPSKPQSRTEFEKQNGRKGREGQLREAVRTAGTVLITGTEN